MGRPRVLICDHPWPDLDVERGVLEPSCEVVEAPDPSEATLQTLAAGVDAIMTVFARVTSDVVAAPRDLKIVARLGTGVDMIDCAAVRARGAVVTNVPEYCTDEVAEHTIGLMFAAMRQIPYYDGLVRASQWRFDPDRLPQRIAGKTLGVCGFGKIGAAVAKRASALGMRALVWSRRGGVPGIATAGAMAADLDTVLRESDVVSLHVPLEPSTERLIDAAALSRMRRGSVLINTSRGALLDEAAVRAAVQDGTLAMVAVDVLTTEPPPPDHPLLGHERIIVTPHVAYWSPEAVATMRRLACEDVARVLRGESPERVVT